MGRHRPGDGSVRPLPSAHHERKRLLRQAAVDLLGHAPLRLGRWGQRGHAAPARYNCGAGSVLILFLIGRRLFDARAGFFSAAFLLTAPMFLFWSRTASAEAINTFTILLMFWAFLKARLDKRPGFLLLFYAVGAAGCFVKGPVAPAVCLFAVLFFSAIESGLRIEKGRMVGAALWKTVGEEFSWLLSGAAVKGILCGLLLFCRPSSAPRDMERILGLGTTHVERKRHSFPCPFRSPRSPFRLSRIDPSIFRSLDVSHALWPGPGEVLEAGCESPMDSRVRLRRPSLLSRLRIPQELLHTPFPPLSRPHSRKVGNRLD